MESCPFSGRTGWDLRPNPLALKLEELKRAGAELFDLTGSNPTQAGFDYPRELLAPLSEPGGLFYDPEPKGLLSARRAVAFLYERKGARVDPDRILLTASTSEAYSFLFRLLAGPGEEILVPRPSYPLFGYLADLSDVTAVSYPLRLGPDRWSLDLDALRAAFSGRTRAIVVVHPNNPTGSGFTREELAGLLQLCRRQGVPLISDEVFAEYMTEEGARRLPPTLAGGGEALLFALGGLSKLLGLPQMKLAWVACSGPEEMARRAMERLELIADSYLSVNTPVQRALPEWLKLAPAIQGQIRRRVRENRESLARAAAGRLARLLPSDGGWSAVLKIPGVRDDEAWALRLLEEKKVLVHPGYLFDFEEPGMAVVSLLPPPGRFLEGIRRLPVL